MSVDYSRLYGKNVVVIECSESNPRHKGRVGIASESCGSYIDEVSKPHNVTVTFLRRRVRQSQILLCYDSRACTW